MKPCRRDRAEGTGEKIAGNVQEKIGRIKKAAGKQWERLIIRRS